MNELCKGTVKVFYQLKGFGFITREKGRDIFFHFSDIMSQEKDNSVFEGDLVEFNVGKSDGKVRALNVRRIG